MARVRGDRGGSDLHAEITEREACRLRRAFAKLDPVAREVFRLHRIEGLSYAGIAERLGMAPDEVERRVADALYELARRMDRPWWKFW